MIKERLHAKNEGPKSTDKKVKNLLRLRGTDIVAYRGAVRSGKESPRFYWIKGRKLPTKNEGPKSRDSIFER